MLKQDILNIHDKLFSVLGHLYVVFNIYFFYAYSFMVD